MNWFVYGCETVEGSNELATTALLVNTFFSFSQETLSRFFGGVIEKKKLHSQTRSFLTDWRRLCKPGGPTGSLIMFVQIRASFSFQRGSVSIIIRDYSTEKKEKTLRVKHP